MTVKIKPANTSVRLNQSIGGQYNLPLPGAGLGDIGKSLAGVGRLAGEVALDMQNRRNELFVNNQLRSFQEQSREALYQGPTSLLNRQGIEAIGSTEKYASSGADVVRDMSRGLENGAQRRVFEERALSSLSSQLDAVARHESTTVEAARVAEAEAVHNNTMDHYVRLQPDAFLTAPLLDPDDPTSGRADSKAGIFKDTIEKFLSTHRGITTETAEVLARAEMATYAHKAALNALDKNGPAAIPMVREFLEDGEYGRLWDADQILTIRNAIDHESALGLYDAIQNVMLADAKYDDAPLDRAKDARKMFEKMFKEQPGRDAPGEYVDEAVRRVNADYSLERAQVEARKTASEDKIFGDLYDVLASPNLSIGEADAAMNNAWARGRGNPTVNSLVARLRENYKATGSMYAPKMTTDGYAARGVSDDDLKDLSLTQVTSNMASIDKGNANKYFDRWQGLNLAEPNTGDTKMIDDAIKGALGRMGKDMFKSGSSDLGYWRAEIQDYMEMSNQEWDPVQLRDLTIDLMRSNDASGFDKNEQTWNEFINDPQPLSVADPLDRQMVYAGVATVILDEDLYRRTTEFAGSADEDVIAQFLIDHPKELARILKLGLANPERMEIRRNTERVARELGNLEKPSPPRSGRKRNRANQNRED